MAYVVDLGPGEKLEANIELSLSKKARPFFFAVSNEAVYIPRIKLVAKTDPYYFQQVNLGRVRKVRVRRLRPYFLWILAALMVSIGLLTTIWMMGPVLRKEPGEHRVSGWPIAVFVCGFLVPIAARGRFGLEVEFDEGKYRWKPPLVVDRASKQKVAGALQAIVDACERVGVSTWDARAQGGS